MCGAPDELLGRKTLTGGGDGTLIVPLVQQLLFTEAGRKFSSRALYAYTAIVLLFL